MQIVGVSPSYVRTIPNTLKPRFRPRFPFDRFEPRRDKRLDLRITSSTTLNSAEWIFSSTPNEREADKFRVSFTPTMTWAVFKRTNTKSTASKETRRNVASVRYTTLVFDADTTPSQRTWSPSIRGVLYQHKRSALTNSQSPQRLSISPPLLFHSNGFATSTLKHKKTVVLAKYGRFIKVDVFM